MTIEQIQAVYKARPFKPFDLHLADGRQIPVHRPDFIAKAASGSFFRPAGFLRGAGLNCRRGTL